MQVIGLDVGRSSVKIYTGTKMFSFPSVIGEWRNRNLQTDYGDNAMEGEFIGEKFFAGTLAQNESEYARSMMTDEKAHGDTLLLALIALHRAGYDDYMVVTGLPVKNHNQGGKQAMKDLLIGRHEITLNGIKRSVRIHRVEVAAEGGGAFWSNPQEGLVRLIDAGSKTINFITMRDRRYVDKDSGTLVDKDGNTYGFETNKTNDNRQLANRIAGELGRKWGRDDVVFVSGGKAEALAELLAPYFSNVRPLQNPLFANAIGFHRVGRSLI